MTDRFYDIAELVSGVELPTGEVHVLRLRKGMLTVVVHPLDLLHFDGREPSYEEALAQRESEAAGGASGEPILRLVLRDGKGNERIQTVDARPSSTDEALEFTFADLPPGERFTLVAAVRGGEETVVFEDVPYVELHERFDAVETAL